MFRSVVVENFRCFERFRIEDLAHVNLVAGMNGVGKTALLEALFLLSGAENLPLVAKVSGFRGIQRFSGSREDVASLLWNPLFHGFNTDDAITIAGEIETGDKHQVELTVVRKRSQQLPYLRSDRDWDAGETSGLIPTMLHLRYHSPSGSVSDLDLKLEPDGRLSLEPVPQEPPFPCFFSHDKRPSRVEEEASLYSQLVRSKREFDLVEALIPVEDRLRSIRSLHLTDQSMLYADVGLDQMLPFALLGGGINSLASILLRILNAPKGIVLIDEIENGIHHSALADLWRVVGRAARMCGTQVFATTHSYECIRAAHEAFSEAEAYDFRLHRLDRANGTIAAATFSKETLAAAIDAYFEVR